VTWWREPVLDRYGMMIDDNDENASQKYEGGWANVTGWICLTIEMWKGPKPVWHKENKTERAGYTEVHRKSVLA